MNVLRMELDYHAEVALHLKANARAFYLSKNLEA